LAAFLVRLAGGEEGVRIFSCAGNEGGAGNGSGSNS
jgi:hypothetical protein